MSGCFGPIEDESKGRSLYYGEGVVVSLCFGSRSISSLLSTIGLSAAFPARGRTKHVSPGPQDFRLPPSLSVRIVSDLRFFSVFQPTTLTLLWSQKSERY